MNIRKVKMEDAPRLLEIYSYYVENTAISFECDAPQLCDFSARIAETSEKYPFLVIEDDDRIQGYAYAHAFVGRAAYAHSCELTIYLDKTARRKGYGSELYKALENELKGMGIKNLYSCIGDPIEEDEYLTRDSERFHEYMGFKKVGDFHKCGYKFGRYYNMIWMEKIIGEHR